MKIFLAETTLFSKKYVYQPKRNDKTNPKNGDISTY